VLSPDSRLAIVWSMACCCEFVDVSVLVFCAISAVDALGIAFTASLTVMTAVPSTRLSPVMVYTCSGILCASVRGPRWPWLNASVITVSGAAPLPTKVADTPCINPGGPQIK